VSRPCRAPFLALAGLILTAANVQAQVGPFYGRPGLSPFGYGYGGFGYPWGGFGYYPGAYSSSWSNGFSLYGPPVPTYGSVPGAFGGADQRLGNFPNIHIYNGAGIGLGASGAGGAGPRRRHYYAGMGLAPGATAVSPAVGQATIEVRVPEANAEVYFESINTRQQGTRRVFTSPVLEVGPTYYYQIRARWTGDTGSVERIRSVGVRANETVVVDFTKDERPPPGPAVGTE
jgi:uncharacterized protein (TIGR03000 family)